MGCCTPAAVVIWNTLVRLHRRRARRLPTNLPHVLTVCRTGAVHRPMLRSTAPPLASPEVTALLPPFLPPTPGDVAARLLYLYIKYHLQLGFTTFVQYTQARAAPLLGASAPCAQRLGDLLA